MKKTVLIIGGSKGIGNAIVLTMLANHNIINLSRTDPSITNPNFKHYNCDVLRDNLPELESLDAIIYCPGSINLKPFLRLNLDDFKNDFEINVLGAVRVIQHYLPTLKKGQDPSILLFSTVATKLGMPFHASIATAKSGVDGLVKSLAAELAPTIRVNAIAPTVTRTDLASKLLRNEKMEENIIARHPLKKILNPEDVAQMASYLVSESASPFSGQVFEMDCGIVNLKL